MLYLIYLNAGKFVIILLFYYKTNLEEGLQLNAKFYS